MPKTPEKKKWSADVTAESDALDLEPNVFEKESADEVARSLNPAEIYPPSASKRSRPRKEGCEPCSDAIHRGSGREFDNA